MYRRLAAGLAVVGFITLVIGVLFTVPGSGGDQQEIRIVPAQIEDVERTVFEIRVSESGDARWRVRIRENVSSTDADQIEQFNQFADEFVSEDTETFRNFQTRADQLVQSGTNVTGREMNATDFRRDAYYDTNLQKGIVEMSFRWEGFAVVRNQRVIVSDVFGGGFGILDNQRLEIVHGENLRFESIDPEPDELEQPGNLTGSDWIRWIGPVEFPSGGLNVTMAGPDTVQPNDPGRSSDSDGGSDQQTQEANLMIPIFVTLLVIVALGTGIIWYLSTREQTTTPTPDPAETEPDSAQQEPAEEAISVPQEELLSDEDRVLQLLEENGGRMRQVSIVEETEWSKSKVSMLLSDMEDDGEISKLRVGRENIISLAGQEPDAAGSPFENEGE